MKVLNISKYQQIRKNGFSRLSKRAVLESLNREIVENLGIFDFRVLRGIIFGRATFISRSGAKIREFVILDSAKGDGREANDREARRKTG